MLTQQGNATTIDATNTHAQTPRLAPIKKPKGLILKLIYKLTKMKLGKNLTPTEVIQARFPESLSLTPKLIKLDRKLTIGKTLKFILKTYVATINGCNFCIDIAKTMALMDGLDIEKYDNLLRFEESSAYTNAEKAALRYVEQATRYKHVEDDVFEDLRKYYSEREIVEITWLNAAENYYNLLNGPLNIPSDELCSMWAEKA